METDEIAGKGFLIPFQHVEDGDYFGKGDNYTANQLTIDLVFAEMTA